MTGKTFVVGRRAPEPPYSWESLAKMYARTWKGKSNWQSALSLASSFYVWYGDGIHSSSLSVTDAGWLMPSSSRPSFCSLVVRPSVKIYCSGIWWRFCWHLVPDGAASSRASRSHGDFWVPSLSTLCLCHRSSLRMGRNGTGTPIICTQVVIQRRESIM